MVTYGIGGAGYHAGAIHLTDAGACDRTKEDHPQGNSADSIIKELFCAIERYLYFFHCVHNRFFFCKCSIVGTLEEECRKKAA